MTALYASHPSSPLTALPLSALPSHLSLALPLPSLPLPLPAPLSVEGRLQLLNINLQGVKMEEGVKLEEIAELTEGYSGADITSVCR